MTAEAYPDNWQDIVTEADTVRAFPARIRQLLGSIDLAGPGLEDVRKHRTENNTEAACIALLDYYRDKKRPAWLNAAYRAGEESEQSEAADDILQDIYYGYGEKGRVPRKKSGHLDWTHKGPKNDLQFSCRINRHRYMCWLFEAFRSKGDAAYARRIDLDLRDWLTASGGSANPEGFGPGRLEAALRMPVWSCMFYELQQEPILCPSTRLLMLASIPVHARYLQKSLKTKSNFATMQMHGLGTLGLAFPEFGQADEWIGFALKQMTREITDQVYPDGVQKELTSSYHWVALREFDALAEKMQHAGRKLPAAYRESLENMYDCIAGCIRPNGYMPLNNDSDLKDFRSILMRAGRRFKRKDWQWIAAGSKQGTRPEDPPSRCYPWAGQLISRSGWHGDAHWSFFDAGPFGVGHQHNDKLHLSVHAFGRDLLVDSGRFAYQGELAERFLKSYARPSRSHNVILIDGWGQKAPPYESKKPHRGFVTDKAYDFAIGTFSEGFGPYGSKERPRADVVHTRALLYLRSKGWIAVDYLKGAGKHRITPLWHFHPDCTVSVSGNSVYTNDQGKGNLHIRPLGSLAWNVSVVRGQEKPELQGWYSECYGQAEPAPCAVYASSFTGSAVFCWVMTPAAGRPEPMKCTWLPSAEGTVHLNIGGNDDMRDIIIVMDKTLLPFRLPDGSLLDRQCSVAPVSSP